MFRKICTLLGACAFLMIASSQGPLSARDQTSGAEQPDQTFWLTIKDTSLPDLFEMFIKRYPKSAHRAEAERTLKVLQSGDQPSAMEQAKQLTSASNQGQTVRSVTPATRAPALAAPVLAPAPVLATAPLQAALARKQVPALAPIPAPRAAPKLAPTPPVVTAPVVTPLAARVTKTPANVANDEPVDEVSMETVILIQHNLNRVGCKVGKLDGKWGPKSQASAARFSRTIDQALVTEVPTNELLGVLKEHEDGICAPVYKAKPRLKKYKRARTSPSIRKARKSKRVIHRKKSRKKKAVVLKKSSKKKRTAKKKKAKKSKKYKVVAQSKVKKKKKVKKAYIVKRKPQNSGVSGDPYSDALRGVGATSSGGGGGGGGWN